MRVMWKQGEMADAATYFGLAGELREVPEEDTAGEVSGRDGAGDAVDGVGVVDRAVLSEGRQRASADGVEHHAAHLLPAALVQFVGPGGGRGIVRFAVAAPVCRCRSGPRAGAGRDDHPKLPPLAGET